MAKNIFYIHGVDSHGKTVLRKKLTRAKVLEFAAYLGLVPKQRSSGGKQKLLGISKRGDKYIRTMLVHGARAAVTRNESVQKSPRIKKWIEEIKERQGFN